MNTKILFLFTVNFIVFHEAKKCIYRDFKHGSTVCVCNSTYCDTIDPVQVLPEGEYILYSSNKEGFRFLKQKGHFTKEKFLEDVLIEIDPEIKMQKILGWGGAFTDSSGYNIMALNNATRENLMRSYFSKEGIEYTLCRVPIASTDMSLKYYSYDDVPGDINLTHFKISDQDYKYKIPLLQQALELSNGTVNFFASAWTPPSWMKTNNQPTGMGFLKKEYYQTWTDYHIKFLDAYKNEGIPFWGITTGNEPTLGFIPFFDIVSLAWFPWDQGNWISNNLGPTLKNNSNYSNLKIIAFDDERLFLPVWLVLETINNHKALTYIDGVGVHGYLDAFFPFLLQITSLIYPNKFILGTESCTGDRRYIEKVALGNWRRGEQYAEDIMEDLENMVTGWVQWNIALNQKGGPSYINNFMDSTIIVNAANQEFYKNPTFYTMGHFSKFLVPGSVRIFCSVKQKGIRGLAFQRPDNGTVIIIYNRHDYNKKVTVFDERRGYLNLNITKRSINTVLYW